MYFTESYNDLLAEIDMLEIRIKDMERERDFLRKSMYANAPKFKGVVDYSKEQTTGGLLPMSLDKIVDRLMKIDYSLEMHYEITKVKKDAKKKIDESLNELEGLEYKVAYLRDVKKMRLHEIASELGYSEDHIRRVSSKVKKPQRCHKKVAKV